MKGVPHSRWFGWLSVVIVAGYFMVGLWPFDFNPPNRVTWLPNRAGLHFAPYGIAYDPMSLPLFTSPGGGNKTCADFTLELWIAAHHEPANNVFDILTIHNPRLPYDFTLCQWKQDFLFRATTRPRQRSGKIPEVDLDDVLPAGKSQFFTVRSDEAGTDLYLNGKNAEHFTQFVLDANALNGQLILGNDAAGKQPWTGSLLGVAIYNRTFNTAEIARHYALWTQGRARELTKAPGLRALYLFDEGPGQIVKDFSGNGHSVMIPAVFQPIQRDFLIAPWKDVAYRHLDYSDMVINILGFMPFGFCFFAFRQRHRPNRVLANTVLVVLIGLAISLIIEIIQAWLPNRVSSSMDLLTNTFGTLIGATLAVGVESLFRTSKS